MHSRVTLAAWPLKIKILNLQKTIQHTFTTKTDLLVHTANQYTSTDDDITTLFVLNSLLKYTEVKWQHFHWHSSMLYTQYL
jgi:hypothetical protein